MNNLRFLADGCIPNKIIDILRACDYKVLKLRELIDTDSKDSGVLEKALEIDTVLLSLDDIFYKNKSFSPDRFKGIISLKINNNPDTIKLILPKLISLLVDHDRLEYYCGKLIIVEPDGVTI